MIVLINALSARLGGGQTYLHNLLLNAPQSESWKIYLLCPDNFDLTNMPPNVKRINIDKRLDNPFRRAIWELINLAKLSSEVSADVLFCPGGLLPSGNFPKGLKTVVTFQNMLPFDKDQRKRYGYGYRWFRDILLERGLASAMRKADLVIFISNYARDFILHRLGELSGKNVIIPHGIDACFLQESHKALQDTPDDSSEEYFLYVSYVDFYKSQIEVVNAYAKVREKTNTKTLLILAGAENPIYGRLLRDEIQKLNLNHAVKLLGSVPHEELPVLYQNAKINLFASCTENCPNILLELMASGRPALVSDRGPMPEFASDTVTYFDPDNIEQLVERWVILLSDTELASKLAKAAKQHVSYMRWRKTAKSTWGAIESLVHI